MRRLLLWMPLPRGPGPWEKAFLQAASFGHKRSNGSEVDHHSKFSRRELKRRKPQFMMAFRMLTDPPGVRMNTTRENTRIRVYACAFVVFVLTLRSASWAQENDATKSKESAQQTDTSK